MRNSQPHGNPGTHALPGTLVTEHVTAVVPTEHPDGSVSLARVDGTIIGPRSIARPEALVAGPPPEPDGDMIEPTQADPRLRSEAAALRVAGDALARIASEAVQVLENARELMTADDLHAALDAWRSAAGSPITDGKAPADESAAAGPEGAPRANWSGAWAELTGYVRAASSPIDPDRLDVYLTELERKALRPVREWMENVMAGQPVRDSQDGGDRG